MAVNLQPEIANTRAYLNEAKKALVLLGRKPNFDQIAAGLGLYLALNKIGKISTIASPEPVTVEFGNLIGVDKITQSLGGKNFIISLDYTEGAIEKVSYNIEGNKFNLVIEPKENAPPLDPSKVSYSCNGGSFDLIFVIGVSNLEDLGKLYAGNSALFSQKPIVSIDTNRENKNFGRANFVLPTASSVSEIVSLLLRSLGTKLDIDIATNLLAGIYNASNNLTSKVTADTFEAVAYCLRSGGRVPKRRVPLSSEVKIPTPATQAFQSSSLPIKPTLQPLKKLQKPAQQKTPSPQEEAPSDWLKPKIYRSGKNTVGDKKSKSQPSSSKTDSKLL